MFQGIGKRIPKLTAVAPCMIQIKVVALPERKYSLCDRESILSSSLHIPADVDLEVKSDESSRGVRLNCPCRQLRIFESHGCPEMVPGIGEPLWQWILPSVAAMEYPWTEFASGRMFCEFCVRQETPDNGWVAMGCHGNRCCVMQRVPYTGSLREMTLEARLRMRSAALPASQS